MADAAATRRTTIEEVLGARPADDLTLWRYMDLAKFLHLIQSKSLWFSRYDLLGDPNEASIPLQVYEAREKARAEGKVHIFDQGDLRESLRTGSYAMCWHANAAESRGMWDLYGRVGSSVCVRTTAAKLGAALPFMAYFFEVKYLDYDSGEWDDVHPMNRFVHKRIEFQHEQEVRALVIDPDAMGGKPVTSEQPDHPQFKLINSARRPGGMEFGADVAQLLDAVRISPDAPGWFEDVLRKELEVHGIAAPLERSRLSARPLF